MDRVETPTAELLRGIAKALGREARDTEGKRELEVLTFLIASVLDALEALTGTDV